jgi:hypothetical protein
MSTATDDLRAIIDNLRAGREDNRKMLKIFEKALAQAERQERSHKGSQSWIAYCALPTLRERVVHYRELIADADDALSKAVWAEEIARRHAAAERAA